MGNQPKHNDDGGLAVELERTLKTKRPSPYRVIMLNDDFTPMEFVVWVLQTVFHKPPTEAHQIMLTVHTQGQGDCGVFPFDVARTKVYQVHTLAEQHEHPLRCVLEAAPEGDEGEGA